MSNNNTPDDIENKAYQTELDTSLLSSVSVSIFCFIAAINIRNTIQTTTNGNRFIVFSLVMLSIAFAIIGLIKYTTEFFNDLTGKYRYQFNYFSAVFYTILICILIIIELIFAKEVWYRLL